MLTNPTRLLFLCTLTSGTVIAISSTSWLGAWVGLEINLLSFIPLMVSSNNQFATEAALKYFLTQAIASALLLFTLVMFSILTSFSFTMEMNPSLNLLFNSTLMLKMGAAPFHFWFPGVMEGLNWMNGLILMTWQKIAPLMLLSYIFTFNLFSTTVIIASVLIGSLGGFNQTSLRKIMAYSSINHLGWMLSALLLGETYWITYFSFYTFLSFSTVLLFNLFQLTHLNQIFYPPSNNNVLKLALFCNLLSLGGLPPFLGFFPKWLIIQGMVSAGLIFPVSVIVMLTLITLYYYLRVGYGAFMITHAEPKWNSYTISKNSMTLIITLTTFSFTGLLLCSGILATL